MTVLLRASMTSEDAAELLRIHLTAQVIDELSALIDAPDARVRAALAGALLMGVASQRNLLRIPALYDAGTDEIVDLVAPLLNALINP